MRIPAHCPFNEWIRFVRQCQDLKVGELAQADIGLLRVKRTILVRKICDDCLQITSQGEAPTDSKLRSIMWRLRMTPLPWQHPVRNSFELGCGSKGDSHA